MERQFAKIDDVAGEKKNWGDLWPFWQLPFAGAEAQKRNILYAPQRAAVPPSMGIIQGEIDIYGVLERLDKMPQQRQFISAPQPNAAYVGGQGSGKSIALCATAILNAIDDPNGYSLIGRLNMPALETTTMKTFLELVPEGMGEWLVSKKMFRFSNGHEVIFRHLDITEPKIEGHIKSLNLSAAYVDEATEISRDVYNLLIGRIRRKTAKRRITRLASNPAGHDWVWRQFFDPKRKPELLTSNLGITASTR